MIYSLMSASQLCYPKGGEGEGGEGEEVAQGKGKRKGKEEGKGTKGQCLYTPYLSIART